MALLRYNRDIKGGAFMPQIIPIRDLKDTSTISALCKQTGEPIFITKNGYGDMVIMSMDTYEKTMLMQDVYDKLAQSQMDFESGNTLDALEALQAKREKYGI